MITRFSRTGRYLRQLLVVVPLALLLPLSTYAGSGTSTGGVFNFCVSADFSLADPADRARIETTFRNGNQVVADSTDGQHRFGVITLVPDAGASEAAEYSIHLGTGDPYVPWNRDGMYSVRGVGVNLYFDSNFSADPVNADRDAYTIAHEHAHHAYGLLDEYVNSALDPAECADVASDPDTPDEASLSYSLMDNFHTRGGRALGGGYTLNEFCVPHNHDPDRDTWQSEEHRTDPVDPATALSAWEVIAAHSTRPATAPAPGLLPVDLAPVGIPDPVFRIGAGEPRVMLLLDRSGSMGALNRLQFAKDSANTYISLLSVDDYLGVASFGFTDFATPGDQPPNTVVNFPMAQIQTGDTTQTDAQTAVNLLVAAGNTNFGDGMRVALGQLSIQADRSCVEFIILVSDGDHNTGEDPFNVIPDLRQEGVAVLTVGVGDTISDTGLGRLENLASDSGGVFFRVADFADLTNLSFDLVAQTTPSEIVQRAPLTIGSGETATTDVLIEAGATGATFSIVLAEYNASIELELQTPSGTVITKNDGPGDPNVDFLTEDRTRTFKIADPESGVWTMIIKAGQIPSGTLELEAITMAENSGVRLTALVDNGTPAFPEPIVVHAFPTFRSESVVGAKVTGTVTRPDDSKVPVVLFDDGRERHGDVRANDGVYSARFNSYNEDGAYTFELSVTNETGVTFAGEPLFVDQPRSSRPVPPFTRATSTAAVVSNVPDYIVATVEYGPETINLKSNGNYVKAYIELPYGYSPYDIDLDTLAIIAVDGQLVTPPIEVEPKSIAKPKIGDFDEDGIPDLKVKFSRCALQQVLTPGVREIYLQGTLANGGLSFIGKRSVVVKLKGHDDDDDDDDHKSGHDDDDDDDKAGHYNGYKSGHNDDDDDHKSGHDDDDDDHKSGHDDDDDDHKSRKECATTHVLSDEVYTPPVPAWLAANSGDGSSAGAGCSFGRNARVDPVLPLLLALSAAYLLRRRRRVNR